MVAPRSGARPELLNRFDSALHADFTAAIGELTADADVRAVVLASTGKVFSAGRDITSQVEEIVRQSGIQEGLLLCNAMHITASVFINDDEPGLHEVPRPGPDREYEERRRSVAGHAGKHA